MTLTRHAMKPETSSMGGRHFAATWSASLKIVSLAATFLLVGISLLIWFQLPKSELWLRALISATTLLMPVVCALFMIRSYRLEGRWLLIQRWLWQSRISLEGLRDASLDTEAMRQSLRICGNGGLFSFSGWYRSKRLGVFRAYVTDLNRTVVLTFPSRKIVLSPDRPEAFVDTVRHQRQLSA
jgi:hypothetical protein